MTVSRLGSPVQNTGDDLVIADTAGTNRGLIGFGATEHFSTVTIDDLDYGGQTLEIVGEAGTTEGGGNHNYGMMGFLDDAGIAAASNTTLTMNTTATADAQMIHALMYEGVDQTGGATTFPDTFSLGDDSSPADPFPMDVTEVDGGCVVAGFTYMTTGGVTWNAAMTEQTDNEAATTACTSMADRLSTTNANVDVEATPGSSSSRSVGVCAAFAPAGSPELEQEGFRVYNDDGSESASTPIDSQDTNVNVPKSTNAIIRFLIAASDNPASKTLKIRYKLKTDPDSEKEFLA